VSWRWSIGFSGAGVQRKTQCEKAGGCVSFWCVPSFYLFTVLPLVTMFDVLLLGLHLSMVTSLQRRKLI